MGLKQQDLVWIRSTTQLPWPRGRPGVLSRFSHGCAPRCHGQILEAFSIPAGLDYPGIGPEHSHYHDIKRASYVPVTDEEALEGFQLLSRVEGIIPALESSHAIAFAVKLAKELGPDKSMIVCLSGRGTRMWFKLKTAWKQMQQRREKPCPKTLTENWMLSKQLKKEFCSHMHGWRPRKGLDGLGETIHF